MTVNEILILVALLLPKAFLLDLIAYHVYCLISRRRARS